MGRIPREDWICELQVFSERNASWPMALEVDQPEFGAQHEAAGLELRGVAYDPRDDRIEIMLSGDHGNHLTHTIEGVTALDLLAGHTDRGEVLRIAHGDGQTLLRIVRTF